MKTKCINCNATSPSGIVGAPCQNCFHKGVMARAEPIPQRIATNEEIAALRAEDSELSIGEQKALFARFDHDQAEILSLRERMGKIPAAMSDEDLAKSVSAQAANNELAAIRLLLEIPDYFSILTFLRHWKRIMDGR